MPSRLCRCAALLAEIEGKGDVNARGRMLAPWPMRRGFGPFVAAITFLVVVGVVSWYELSRKLAPPDTRPTEAQWALSDFRANLYYPTRWLLQGGNPYDGRHAEIY